jgi:ribonuclease HII
VVKIPKKTLERQLFKEGYDAVIGVDEVGMACLAGPVTVCAVRFTPAFYERTHKRLAWLRDSKALAPHQREQYAAELMTAPYLQYRIASCLPATIDTMNIYQASRRAMRRAIRALSPARRPIVLVDGNRTVDCVPHEQIAIVKGDRHVFAIACASIIAKVYRDNHMTRQAKRYPGYGFEQHKGYPTKMHYERLGVLGPTKLHRRSFSMRLSVAHDPEASRP